MTALAQGDTRLLNNEVAKRLLASTELARVAYVEADGTPRVLPMMFHWNGSEVVLVAFVGTLKIPAMCARPDVAITIDTNDLRPEVLSIRGRASITDADGILPEFVQINHRYLGPEFGAERVAEVDRLGMKMVRIAVRPTWVGVIDFQTRFPSRQQTMDEFLEQHFPV